MYEERNYTRSLMTYVHKVNFKFQKKNWDLGNTNSCIYILCFFWVFKKNNNLTRKLQINFKIKLA